MPKKLTFAITRDQLGTYDGATLGWFFITEAGLAAAGSAMQYVDDLAASYEIAGDPGDVRGVIDVVIQAVDGDSTSTLLTRDPESTIPTADTTGASPAAVVFYDTTGGSDAARKLVALLAYDVVEAGFAGWEVDPAAGIAEVSDNSTLAAQVASLVASASPTGVVDGVIAADAVDGTGVQFTALVLDYSATAAGIVPAGWAGVPGLTDLDATELAGVLAMGYPSGATFIVYSDGDWSVRFITDDTVNAPWTIVSAVDVTGGSLGSLVDGEFYETHAWRVLYSGTGLFDGQTNAGDAMHQFEGALDRWFFASAVGTTDKDLADLGAETWEYGDPKFTDGNSDPVDFCHVWLFGQTDPAENGAYTVNDDFTYVKIPHPDVFDPPGQGYRVTVVAPGDPASGTTWVWLVDKPDSHFRANGSTDPDEAGEWVLWVDPVGGGGAVTLTGDVTGTGTGTITTAIGTGVIVDADVNASAAIAQSKIASLTSDLAAKAPLASPALTGNPTAPTQSAGNNSTRLATTAYTDTAVAAVPLPWLDHIYIPSARYPDALTGTWGVTAAAVIGGGYTGSALTNDQSYTYARLPIRAGTYTMRVYRRNTANSGIITITLGGSSVGTVDAYSASSANDTLSTITGITVSASGFLDLVLTNPTKNPSSGAYEMRFQLIDLYRTGP